MKETLASLKKRALKLHSNPKAFIAMLEGNKKLSAESKIQALKNYIRKHGRRSSTLD